jgi:ribosome biogenesis GTPase
MTTLQNLGWRPYFESQRVSGDGLLPARVMAVHRARVELAGDGVPDAVSPGGRLPGAGIAIGDWVLVDPAGPRIVRVLDRTGVFKRRAAGTGAETQLIAANVDTLFVVTSANRDFNVARLERYLAIAHEGGAFPVIVITKADTVPSAQEYVSSASRLSPGLVVEALDARDPAGVSVLEPWCEAGQTVALLGSSGVGKSTLINTLAGTHQETRGVREDDQRGRHTTTARSMHELPSGGWLIDTPGMRELQLVDVGDALDDVFSDVSTLAGSCRFGDCQHESEPGCAVRAAIDDGELDADRLRRYRKLLAEDRRNTETLAERRTRDRQLGRLYKTILSRKQQRKDGE